MSFDLTSPAWLATLLLVPVLAYYFARSLVDLPRPQRLVSLIVRGVICLLLSLALAGLTLVSLARDDAVLFSDPRVQEA